MGDLVVTHQQALEALQKQETPESKAIIEYVDMVKKKNIAILGEDECFILEDSNGQIKGFKRSLVLSAHDGTLVKPGFGSDMPHVVSAQGYEKWAESTGTSVVFPKMVLVGNDWKPNPYAERDPVNRRILAVHASAIAFGYSSMGIPRVSAWTTIFDTPSYRMIDLLAKAKKYPQAFKVLPTESKPKESENETWASYPFDESMNLWINTSHDEVIKWLSQILNREKKAIDYAQTFAKRNALKHLSGIQKAPGNQWRIPVIAWRPTGNNIMKWDEAQYVNLQERVAGMANGGMADEFSGKVELIEGSERTSDDEYSDVIESEVDPEDTQESEGQQKPEKEASKEQEEKPKTTAKLPKEIQQAVVLSGEFPSFYRVAADELGIQASPEKLSPANAIKICARIGELVDQEG